ncbi:hypothetical protein BKI52_33235 [marine bacterium AO1-C]|nr:hypothetical protein BKI52_33235 [marine bacterium AO1-C]
MNSTTLTINTPQKMLWALHSSSLSSEPNAAFVKEWYEQVHLPSTTPEQNFELWSTHDRQRLTLYQIGATHTLITKHAAYYQNRLQVNTNVLQRLRSDWRPEKLGSWVEIHPEGVNTGWYLPGLISFNQLCQVLEKSVFKQKIIHRWANMFVHSTCIGYGESWSTTFIRQVDLMANATQSISSQYHKALHLCELLEVPTFPSFLLEIFQTHEVHQLGVSLWMTDESVLKFGLRVFKPSIKLLMALCLLASFTDEDEDFLAQIHSMSARVQWVEVQQTTDGLKTEVSYQL